MAVHPKKLLVEGEFAELPDQIPAEGLEIVHSGGPRFGVWIMPDNRFTGMPEDFLVRLIPDDSRGLYELARRCVAEASRNGAPFRAVHRTKAEIYTWLAWQDEPGPQLHEAVDHRMLRPTRPESRSFANGSGTSFVCRNPGVPHALQATFPPIEWSRDAARRLPRRATAAP